MIFKIIYLPLKFTIMKTYFLISFVLITLLSCTDNSSVINADQINKKTFSSNSSTVGLHNTLSVTYEGKNVEVIRTMEKFDEKEVNNNVVFIEGDVATKRLEDGGIEISKKSKEVWFIPFLVGSDPVKLEIGYCWRFYCTCGGYPSFIAGGCTVVESPYSVGCSGSCEGSCVGFAMKVLCGSSPSIDHDPLLVYTGGVILEAENVKVIDPEGEEYQKVKGIDFYQTNDGRMMKLEDAIKSEDYKKK
jgi:hypothetical protein